jgi:hypothetical protein
LVCGNDGESNILYFNEGGLFATLPAWSSGQTNSTRGVALGDVDADGDLDLICGNGPIFGQSNTLYFNEGGLFATLPAWSSGPTDRTRGVVLGDVDADGDVDLVCGNAGRSTLYRNERNPVLKGDPAAPQNHLPNNSAFATAVSFAHADTNLYRVSARLFDVESDPVWIVAEYQFDGAPQWFPAVLDNQPSGIGPLPTSPDGVAHTIHWDVSTVPFDSRDVILRLRVVSVPQRVSPMQHIASHTIRIGSIEPVRGELAVSTTSLSFTTVTLGDTTSAALSLWNRGKSLIRVTNLQPTSTNTHIDQSAPFSIASGGRVDLTLFYAPLDAGSDPGALRIESDGLLTPIVIVDLDAVVRRVNFIVTNLYPQGEISQGVELSIAAVMADSVHADSALVFFRKGGAKAFRDVRLTQIADPVNEQYVGGVPADSISSRGVEYYVKVFNGAASNESTIERLHQRVKDTAFPSAQPPAVYRMVSIPLEMEGTILGTLGDDLGVQDATRWRMFGYDDNAARYVALPNDSIFSFDQGRAYWLISNESRTLDTGPAEGLSTPTDRPSEIELSPGWNMIGNPFNFPVAWDSMTVGTLTMAEAESTTVEPPIGWVVGAGYQYGVRTLEPFDGYWVKNVTASSVTLKIPPVEADDGSAPTVELIAQRSESAWRLGIAASSAEVVDRHNYIGMQDAARTAWDRFDRSEAPISPGNALSLYFSHDDWEGRPGYYSVDIRGRDESLKGNPVLDLVAEPDAWGQVWYFDVAKNFSHEPAGDKITLEFSGIEGPPREAKLYLIDRHLDRLIDLRQQTIYSFFLAKRDVVPEDDARFAVLVGSEAFIDSHGDELPRLPTTTALHQNYPNPFNPSTVIRYELAQAGRVDLRIYDARGALVKVVEAGHRPPGRYEVGWGGENKRGAMVASGVYFYRLTAGDKTLTKKMVLLK